MNSVRFTRERLYTDDIDTDSENDSADSASTSSWVAPGTLFIGLDPCDIESLEIEFDYEASAEGVEIAEILDSNDWNASHSSSSACFLNVPSQQKGPRQTSPFRSRRQLDSKDLDYLPVIPESVSKGNLSDSWLTLATVH